MVSVYVYVCGYTYINVCICKVSVCMYVRITSVLSVGIYLCVDNCMLCVNVEGAVHVCMWHVW